MRIVFGPYFRNKVNTKVSDYPGGFLPISEEVITEGFLEEITWLTEDINTEIGQPRSQGIYYLSDLV